MSRTSVPALCRFGKPTCGRSSTAVGRRAPSQDQGERGPVRKWFLQAELGRVGVRRCVLSGAPEEIRTPDPQIRSLVLYPAELRALDPAAGSRPARTGHSY